MPDDLFTQTHVANNFSEHVWSWGPGKAHDVAGISVAFFQESSNDRANRLAERAVGLWRARCFASDPVRRAAGVRGVVDGRFGAAPAVHQAALCESDASRPSEAADFSISSSVLARSRH